jgi:hypothetical protein
MQNTMCVYDSSPPHNCTSNDEYQQEWVSNRKALALSILILYEI